MRSLWILLFLGSLLTYHCFTTVSGEETTSPSSAHSQPSFDQCKPYVDAALKTGSSTTDEASSSTEDSQESPPDEDGKDDGDSDEDQASQEGNEDNDEDSKEDADATKDTEDSKEDGEGQDEDESTEAAEADLKEDEDADADSEEEGEVDGDEDDEGDDDNDNDDDDVDEGDSEENEESEEGGNGNTATETGESKEDEDNTQEDDEDDSQEGDDDDEAEGDSKQEDGDSTEANDDEGDSNEENITQEDEEDEKENEDEDDDESQEEQADSEDNDNATKEDDDDDNTAEDDNNTAEDDDDDDEKSDEDKAEDDDDAADGDSAEDSGEEDESDGPVSDNVADQADQPDSGEDEEDEKTEEDQDSTENASPETEADVSSEKDDDQRNEAEGDANEESNENQSEEESQPEDDKSGEDAAQESEEGDDEKDKSGEDDEKSTEEEQKSEEAAATESEADGDESEEVGDGKSEESDDGKSGEEKEGEGESAEDAATEEAESQEDETAQESDEDPEQSDEEDEEEAIPYEPRSREHLTEILGLDDSEKTKSTYTQLEQATQVTLKDLKRIYENAIKPLEKTYKYRDLSNRHFGDPEIFSKPLVVFMGPWSGGKSTIINWLLGIQNEEVALRTGADPSPAQFNIMMYGKEDEVLDGTQLAADWTFSGLQKFGQSFLDRLRGRKLPNRLLEKVNIVEIPGILEVRKQVERSFPFNDACQWFIDRADVLFLVYDPAKLDIGPETEAILDQLKGRENQVRIVLNKADTVKPEELLRVQATLVWNISPLMSSAEPPVMYAASLWDRPFQPDTPRTLLTTHENNFLKDIRDGIEKRVESRIAAARRFAVRVRNHAKMVDCYLNTYNNHRSFFSDKKKVSNDIIDHPQNYHIYEGLSTLTNISRYDLPDPDTYRDFFKLNPLWDFPTLSSTCTYFKGCPINKLDIAIAYELPDVLGKFRRQREAILTAQAQAPATGTSKPTK